MARLLWIWMGALGFSLVLISCSNRKPTSTLKPAPNLLPTLEQGQPTLTPAATFTPTPIPRQLTICLGREPKSLFLYGASTAAAQNILAAIYDGPFEPQNFNNLPVILERNPSLQNGDVALETVQMQAGDPLVDANGDLNVLGEGVSFRSAGCRDLSCAQTYAGDQPVSLDRVVVRFRLKPGLKWSDGTPLTAHDSVYSFQVAQALGTEALPALVSRTESYRALDDVTVEWTGLPGYQDGDYAGKFFVPLPSHALESIKAESLPSADVAARTPLGWGAYVLEGWVAGESLTLHKNPDYFRNAEGLPHFDQLTYRFIPDNEAALQALLSGTCDLVDSTAFSQDLLPRLLELQDQGQLKVVWQPEVAWEQITFGVASIDPAWPTFLADKAVRQAIALCIDRQALVDSLFRGSSSVAGSYLPPEHPDYNPDLPDYPYNPQQAANLLTSAGWVDADNDPSTPRTAQAVPGVIDGTPLEIGYLAAPDRKEQAERVQGWLGGCGIGVRVELKEASQYLAPGPGGPVFGRRFDLAQFAWPASSQPPCFLYLSREIPAEYPTAPKGWGGANASGYSNPEFDRACQTGLWTLPDFPEHHQANLQAQVLFAEDLPALPLYWQSNFVVTRPDLCGLQLDASTRNALWNIETWDTGAGCPLP